MWQASVEHEAARPHRRRLARQAPRAKANSNPTNNNNTTAKSADADESLTAASTPVALLRFLRDRVNWLHAPLLIGTPILALYGLATTPLVRATALFSVVWYFMTGVGITGGYHRLWAHRKPLARAREAGIHFARAQVATMPRGRCGFCCCVGRRAPWKARRAGGVATIVRTIATPTRSRIPTRSPRASSTRTSAGCWSSRIRPKSAAPTFPIWTPTPCCAFSIDSTCGGHSFSDLSFRHWYEARIDFFCMFWFSFHSIGCWSWMGWLVGRLLLCRSGSFGVCSSCNVRCFFRFHFVLMPQSCHQVLCQLFGALCWTSYVCRYAHATRSLYHCVGDVGRRFFTFFGAKKYFLLLWLAFVRLSQLSSRVSSRLSQCDSMVSSKTRCDFFQRFFQRFSCLVWSDQIVYSIDGFFWIGVQFTSFSGKWNSQSKNRKGKPCLIIVSSCNRVRCKLLKRIWQRNARCWIG